MSGDQIVFASLDVDALALAHLALVRKREVTRLRLADAQESVSYFDGCESAALRRDGGSQWAGRMIAEYEHCGMFADLLLPDETGWSVSAPDLGLPFHVSAGACEARR